MNDAQRFATWKLERIVEKQTRVNKRCNLVVLLNDIHCASTTIQAVMSCYDATFSPETYACERCGFEFTTHDEPKLCGSCGSPWASKP